jgi:hypothetical protein
LYERQVKLLRGASTFLHFCLQHPQIAQYSSQEYTLD